MNKRQKALIKNLLAWVVISLTAIFFIKSLQSNWNNIENLSLKPDALTILATVCFVLSIVSTGVVWGNLVERLTGRQIKKSEAIRIQLASWLLKYIPGQAGSFINKINWGRKKGIDGKKITASFIYENIFLLLASTITTIPILFVALSSELLDGLGSLLPLIVAIPIVAVVLSPRFFTFGINLLFKLLKKQKFEKQDLLSPKDNFIFLVKFIVPRMINGAAFMLLTESVVGIGASQYVIFWAIYVLAGIVGLLAIFVPSGLGVREGVIVLFASAYMPTEQAVALSLVARFYATVADLGVAILYVYLNHKKGEVV